MLKYLWKSLSRVQLFVTPWTYTQSMKFSRPEYWVGSLSLLQRIFPTQGFNPGLLHCRWILYQLSHQGSLKDLIFEWKWVKSNMTWPELTVSYGILISKCLHGVFIGIAEWFLHQHGWKKSSWVKLKIMKNVNARMNWVPGIHNVIKRTNLEIHDTSSVAKGQERKICKGSGWEWSIVS